MSAYLACDRFLVRRLDECPEARAADPTVGARDGKPHSGRVIAIRRDGPLHDVNIRGLAISFGDRVLYADHAGVEVRIAGQTHLLVGEDDILAILD
jgi:co-chaperonin GroES (HSP10)